MSPKTCSSLNLSLLILFTFLGFSLLNFIPTSQNSAQCSATSPSPVSVIISDDSDDDELRLSMIEMVPRIRRVQAVFGFWHRVLERIGKDFEGEEELVVAVVSDGLNQQRNQVIHAVVTARILEAALVVPVFQVAFHALRRAAPIQELGNRLDRRMCIEGPYISIHMRLEKDVWVRISCLRGLGPEYDDVIGRDRHFALKR
ncbi:O-fucosyltransferase family protein [Actinidia rufa]|uniref:O-fucosyltransferase family protein n=1 Tax=Actinidia rufa TaxID=165716 RepID=A0A7J0DPP5_9ERIC|nr:O-fucosyltransferase family protein [Actinidia rufa]